ncbi:MAG: cob(I)yrinic acid a,c-diamide adenosyltransferase [Lachnospiraceae bacterium]|nr:cob(I)yrinic acid a,c-diamide adenosyltransferase [Lachnospiraceae bacterium]
MGLIHLYYGDGKGKTTAAAGLALRALGAGMAVTFVRFLKSDGWDSKEAVLLKQCGAEVINGKTTEKFISGMEEAEKREIRMRQDEILKELMKRKTESSTEALSELVVLDEALTACRYELLDEELLKLFLSDNHISREIVLTGRAPMPWMLETADYITRFQAEKHPYEKGIKARKGIEY